LKLKGLTHNEFSAILVFVKIKIIPLKSIPLNAYRKKGSKN